MQLSNLKHVDSSLSFAKYIHFYFGNNHECITFVARHTVVVAQLVRASVCGTEGRGFEPHHPP